jgi:4a-hydroxytetrahydrobiopterin dehydratase
MAVAKLSDAVVQKRLAELPGWSLKDGKLHREYKFADFVEAFSFMSACALCAERADHHPEWFNVWNRVVVDLTTHDAGGISERDFALASKMEKLAA